MDQIKIGKFISALRRERSMTQRELADKLMISDKTVSKWESGRGLPEVSLMMPLCEILGISVNELLSGERLDDAEYRRRAEDNMMRLVEERRRAKRTLAVEFVVILISMLSALTMILVSGLASIDLPLRITLVVIAFVVLALGIAVAASLEMSTGCFECPRCANQFLPTPFAYIMGMHTVTRRWLKCPKCGKSSMCIRRLTKDK